MGDHRPVQLGEHTTPPFRPHTPDPHHESKTFRRNSIARAEHALQQLLFGDARVKKHAVEERVHQVQESDAVHRECIVTPPGNSSSEGVLISGNAINPSGEAERTAKVDRNGFGDNEDTCGWPGLGTWSESHVQAPVDGHQKVTEAKKKRDIKLQAVVNEAIDEAGGESYGWPGLMDWRSSK